MKVFSFFPLVRLIMMSFGLGLNVSQANLCVDSFAHVLQNDVQSLPWEMVVLSNGCFALGYGHNHFVSRHDFSQGQMCCTRISREMVVLPTNLKKWDMLSRKWQCFEQHNHFVVAQHIDHLLISSSKKLDLPSKFTIFTNNQIM